MRSDGALIGWWPLCRVHSQGVPVECTAISKVEERLEPLHQQLQYFRLISKPGHNLPEPELELQILRDPQRSSERGILADGRPGLQSSLIEC
jgi:hypothetical protein